MRTAPTRTRQDRPGVVLLAVLLVVALLTLAAYQYAEVMTSEYKAADTVARSAQARAAAASGIYYAASLLSDPNSFSGTLGNNPYDNLGAFQSIPLGSSDTPRFQARFSVVAPPSVDDAMDGSTATLSGVEDEHSKININAVMQVD